jgi:hypothetical protein
MGSIYRCAAVITTYIGPEAENSRLGLDFAYELCSWEHRRRASTVPDPRLNVTLKWPEVGLPPEDNPKWEALRSVLRLPWPSRAWIVQESLLGKQVPITMCGRHKIHWMVIVQTVSLARSGKLPSQVLSRNDEKKAADSLVRLGLLRQVVWTDNGDLVLPLTKR